MTAAPKFTPSGDELKCMVDQLNEAIGEYMVANTEDNLIRAKLARDTVHAGIALICDDRAKLYEALRRVVHAAELTGDGDRSWIADARAALARVSP